MDRKVKQIIFSPTGGTRKVADIITKAWGLTVSEVDLTDAAADFRAVSLEKDQLALIAVPSFGGRVPALAAERIAEIHADETPCVIVCVYGNRAYEDTLIELSDLAQESGFKVVAAVAAIAEHSIMHQYAAGRPDAEDKSQLTDFAGRILEKIDGADARAGVKGAARTEGKAQAKCEAGVKGEARTEGKAQTLDLVSQIPGNRPYKKAGGGGLVPKAGSHCTACGLCAEKCPAQAISLEDPHKTDAKKCISCMRCASVCPASARKLNGAMVSAAALAMKKVCSVRKENELYL